MNILLSTLRKAQCIVFITSIFFCASAAAKAQTIENIIVLAHPLASEGLSQAVDILKDGELDRKSAANIGATLAKQPGIHSASFGNAVGRPVIHGLGGSRVRILEDRIDALDVSTTSADHAVSVEPFIAERIEILKGASTLLYGSGAIGGVVNVHTGRIPQRLPVDGVSGGIESRYNDNGNGKSSFAKVNGAAGRFAWHVDGTSKRADDYDIPSHAESKQLRALENDDEAAHGTLAGSFYESKSGAAGASYFADWGFWGVAVSTIDSEYGLPGGHEHGGEEITPTLELEQLRTDVELDVHNPFGQFSHFNMRLGINDYSHKEIEPDGETATTFDNAAWEFRTELVREVTKWKHVYGVQYTDRRFSALGEEAFIKPVDTYESGVFWLFERPYKHFDFEAGLRVGQLEHNPDAAKDENFFTSAVSVGVIVPLSNAINVGLAADYVSRAPVAEELYSNGPHLVTGKYETGNADINNEKAINVSASLAYSGDRWSVKTTAYHIAFNDFIYQQATGQIIAGLPEVRYQQDDARFYGLDVEVKTRLHKWQAGELLLSGIFDVVKARLDIDGNDHVPRLPPLRYGATIHFSHHYISGGIEYLRVTKQNNVAELELATDAYNDFGAYLELDLPVSQAASMQIFVRGKNLTDDEQRAHSSFIKDLVPAAGRSVESGIRYSF